MRTVKLAPVLLAALLAIATPALSGSALSAPEDKPIVKAENLLKSALYADRMHALEIIEGIGADEKAEVLLINALQEDSDWGVQIKAAELLGATGSDDAAAALATACLEGEIQWVREAAIRALGTLRGDEMAETLLAHAKKSRDDAVKARAILAATDHFTKEHISRLVRYVKGKDVALARASARALGRLAGDPEAETSALKGLKSVFSKRGDARSFLPYAGAMEGLVVAGTPRAHEILVSELMAFPDADEYVLERIGRALAAAGDESATATLEPAFAKHVKSPKVRRLARLAARAGAVGTRTQVEGLLGHKEARVRSEAARALGILAAPESKEPLFAALEDESWYVRVEACTALFRILPRPEGVALGERLKSDESAQVRLQYITELYDALDPTGIEQLVPYLADDSWRVATAAAATIGALGIAEDMPRLMPLLEHKDWKMRAAGYEGLARMRAAKAIPHLANGLADRDPVVRGVCWTNLQILTMERLGGEPEPWLQWWDKNAATFEIVKRSRRTQAEIEAEEKKNKRYASGSMTRDQGVEILQKARILVISGAWDKVERVLDHLKIKHTLLRAQELKLAGLNPNQILLVNCEGNLDRDTMERVAWFVNVGGYVMTTDWALTKTIMPVFPGYATQFARSSTGNDVVVVEEGLPGHALTAGVFDGVPALQWWLEVQAFPLTVLYPERVDVIVDSAEMRHRYGSTPLGIAFRWGLGKVQHSASHFYLQEEGMQHASKPRDRMVFAADNLGLSLDTIRKMADEGAFSGRITEETLKQIAPDYSMFRMIVNFVREKSEWVENL